MTPTDLVQWPAAVLLALSIFWYQEPGWKRFAAPCIGALGCLGFAAVAAIASLWGVAALNLLLVGINGRNAWRVRGAAVEDG